MYIFFNILCFFLDLTERYWGGSGLKLDEDRNRTSKTVISRCNWKKTKELIYTLSGKETQIYRKWEILF